MNFSCLRHEESKLDSQRITVKVPKQASRLFYWNLLLGGDLKITLQVQEKYYIQGTLAKSRENCYIVCEIPRSFERGSPSNFRKQGSFIHINRRKIFECDLLASDSVAKTLGFLRLYRDIQDFEFLGNYKLT